MIRILHITGSLERNGVETFIMNVFRQIDRTKIIFDFLLFSESEEGYYDEAVSLGSKIYKLPSRNQGYRNYNNSIASFFETNANEYVAVHFSSCTLTTVLPLYYAKKNGINIRIIHAHSSNWEGGIHNCILHLFNRLRIAKLATHYLACSKTAAEWFYSHTPALSKCMILKNGINLPLFQYNLEVREKIRKDLNLKEAFIVGHIGRFDKVKNHTFIIDVFKEIKKKKSNAILLLIGDGILLDFVRDKVKQSGLESAVLFLGIKDNICEFLQAMDCFLFPSLYEGLPLALVEAQAAGLPILVSNSVSKEANLTDNVFFLSLQESASFWAEKAVSLLAINRENAKSMIEKKGYSIIATTQRLMNIYLNISEK